MLPIHLCRPGRRSTLALYGALLLTASAPIIAAEASERRRQLEQLRDVNTDARRNAERLRNEVEQLQAEPTDRGLRLTLDDTLFTNSDAGLSSIGHSRLGALSGFLERYPERSVAIAGYAGAGGYRYDLTLVKRRTETVKAYLIREGISPGRLTVRGNGVVPPDQNSDPHELPRRRVEVMIEDHTLSTPPPDLTTSSTQPIGATPSDASSR